MAPVLRLALPLFPAQNGLDTRYFESTHKMRKSELIAFGIQD